MSNSNDPNRDDPPEVETIQDVRDWYSDPNHYGIPPGAEAVDGDPDLLQLPDGERWQWDYDLADWRRV